MTKKAPLTRNLQSLVQFTIPSTSSIQHQFQEFKKQKKILQDYLQGKFT